MTPKSRDHMPTTSLWGVAAKWPTRAPKTKLILCPRDSCISLSLPGRILKEYQNIMSASKQTPCGNSMVCEIALTEVLATQMGVMQKSARLNCINVIHFHLTAVNCAGAHALLYLGSSANCYSSRQHSRLAQLTFLSTTHIHSLLKNLRWQPH